MRLDSTSLSTFKERLRLLTTVLEGGNMPASLAEHFAGETLLKVYASTPLVTTLSLDMYVDPQELQARMRLKSLRSEPTAVSKETKPQVPRKQKRVQERAFAKFLKKMQATNVF